MNQAMNQTASQPDVFCRLVRTKMSTYDTDKAALQVQRLKVIDHQHTTIRRHCCMPQGIRGKLQNPSSHGIYHRSIVYMVVQPLLFIKVRVGHLCPARDRESCSPDRIR